MSSEKFWLLIDWKVGLGPSFASSDEPSRRLPFVIAVFVSLLSVLLLSTPLMAQSRATDDRLSIERGFDTERRLGASDPGDEDLGGFGRRVPRDEVSVNLSAGYTDNVNLTNEKQSDIPLGLGLGFRLYDRSARTEGSLVGRIEYVDYLQNNAGDEWRPNVRGSARWHLDPNRWAWTLDGVLRQVRRTQVSTDSPLGRETQGIFSTGPEFRIPFSSIYSLLGSAKAGYLFNSQTKDDNYNLRGALRLERRLSGTTALTANVEARAVRYTKSSDEFDASVINEDVLANSNIDEDFLSDFDIVETFLGYSRQDGKIRTKADVGASYTDVKDGKDESDFFLRVDSSRRLSELSRTGLRLYYGFDTEASSGLVAPLAPESAQPSRRTSARVSNVFLEKRGEIYFERAWKRSNLFGTVYARERDFADEIRDERNFGVGLTWSRQLTKLTSGSLSGNFDVFNSKNLALDYKDYGVSARIVRQINRRMDGNLVLRHRERTSDDLANDYDETAVYVYLSYRWFP